MEGRVIMRKAACVIAILCVPALFAPCFAEPAKSATDSQWPYPFDEGRWWTYELPDGGSFTLTVNGTETVCGKKCIRIEGSDGSKYYWFIDDSGIYQTRIVQSGGIIMTFCPPQALVSRNPTPSSEACIKPFDAALRMQDGTSHKERIKGWSLEVMDGVTDVTVPAGTFKDCLQVTSIGRINGALGNLGETTTQVIWICPDIGIVKWYRSDMDGVLRLESYSGPEQD